MSALIKINSTEEWKDTLTSRNVVIADFYADWCGPCKMIAPHFEKLSQQFSKSKDHGDGGHTVAFCKVDVDKVQAVAAECKVRAMPTFLIYHNGTLVDVMQGANPPKLTAAITNAVKPGPIMEPTEAAKNWEQGQQAGAFSFSSLLPFLLMFLLWAFTRKS